MHVHVSRADGEAKRWLAPDVALARNYRLSESQFREVEEVIRKRKDEFGTAWHRHFHG